ncbi:MAG TPA: nuclear transport factor 2 family protein [Pyrinomonadaceae bacterium]
MKRCPTCNKTFTDSGLSFCVDDGTPLVTDSPDDEATLVRARDASESSSGSSPQPDRAAAAYQPPSYVPPGSGAQTNRRAWPWLVGLLVMVVLVVAGLGIAAVFLVPKMLRASSNNNAGNVNANTNRRVVDPGVQNRNLSTPEVNANSNSSTDTSPPPKDREAVLADLKNLEDEWTVANINADKSKLNRILADDYVGITNGRAQGKAEYLKTIERDTAIQHWEFDDLKVSLNGDRATLSGTIKIEAKDDKGDDRELTFQFIDKFVWRDGRWQATSSEVNPVEKPPGVST